MEFDPKKYKTEDKKHVYGKSSRMPNEQLLVRLINRIHKESPEYEMLLLGTSGVHGEKFPLFLTECDFDLPNKEAVERLTKALNESDELIRRRDNALWSWECAWIFGTKVKFFVNWYDFAYFMRHKEIFLGGNHEEYSKGIGLDVTKMKYVHHKILRDGKLVVFDENKITDHEKVVVKHLDKIEFSKSFAPKRF